MARVTLYKPEYCQKLIKHMQKGMSFESFAGLVGVSKQTIYDWLKANPEFADAKSIAVEKARLFWEEEGLKGIWNHKEGPNLNTALWFINMKNRFPDEWRDKRDAPEKPDEEDDFIDQEHERVFGGKKNE